MQVRLTLKQPYTWPSRNPEKPNSNDCGFVQTNRNLSIGDVVVFEDLNPKSLAGDLNTDHYKYFRLKAYKVTRHQNGFLNLVEQ